MTNQEQHVMELGRSNEFGDEEWVCPECGRRMLFQFQPLTQKRSLLIIEAGNENAYHVGSKGGLRIEKPAVQETEAEDSILSQELREALDELDFDD